MSNGTAGIQVDILRRALSDHELTWRQMDYRGLESAVSDQKADVAMTVLDGQSNVFYSVDYIGFVNFAITKRADNLKVERVADLKGHPVLVWQNAWIDLGGEFKNQYAPGSDERTNYVEVANQAEQVRQFWDGDGKVIVIDRSIFDYFSRQQRHSLEAVTYHHLFPKVTKFKVGFAEAAVRDEFNAQLRKLCESGVYHQLLKRYDMPDVASICDQFNEGARSGAGRKQE